MYGQGRPHLSFEQLMATPIAFPSLVEQYRIVAEVDRRFSLIREVETQADANLKRSERLRQSILFAAFSGRLVNVSVDNLVEPTVQSQEAGAIL
jgi:type I restriction enzyme S subunit